MVSKNRYKKSYNSTLDILLCEKFGIVYPLHARGVSSRLRVSD
jgi:hypothetical protein